MRAETDGAFMAPDPRSLLQRMMRRLFPRASLMPSDSQEFSTFTTVHLDWTDRLRVLLSGCLRLEYRHETDVECKQVTSRCAFYVESPLERG